VNNGGKAKATTAIYVQKIDRTSLEILSVAFIVFS